ELELLNFVVALVLDDDLQAAVEIRELAQLLSELLERERQNVLEDLGVGMKRDLRAAAIGDTGLLELGGRNPLRGLLVVDLAVAANLELEPIGQRVDGRHADAVQTARDLVARAAELAAGVQHGHHELRGGTSFDRMNAGGNATPVVL